jgi:DNA-binding response OmpR family regulator
VKSDILQPIAEVANPDVKIPKPKNRILVIDDESDITLTFELILGGEGFEVDSFNDPYIALSNFSPDIYDIALIDVKMPEMDGFDLYRRLKDITSNTAL